MRGCLIIGAALALAITPVMAGGKGGGGGHASTNQNQPQGSVTLNYGKVQQSYTPQMRPDGGGGGNVGGKVRSTTGAAVHQDLTITKHVDVASPSLKSTSSSPKLHTHTSTGQHFKKAILQ